MWGSSDGIPTGWKLKRRVAWGTLGVKNRHLCYLHDLDIVTWLKHYLHDWGKRLTCFHQDLGGLPGHCARRPCMPITMDDGPLVRIWWWGPPGRCDGWPGMPITMDGPVLLWIIMWWWAHRAGLMVGLACLLQWPSFVMVGPPGCCDGWPCVPDTMDCPVIMMWWWAPTWPGSGRPCVPVTMGGPVKMWW